MSAASAEAGNGRAPASSRANTQAPGADPLARIVFALVVLACFAAFLITQRLKHTPTAVQEFHMTPFFSPYPSGHVKEASIAFKLEHAEAVTVTIINSAGNTVATLVHEYELARYKPFSLRWNGRRGSARRYVHAHSPHGLPILIPLNEGPLAPAGEYRVRVTLRHHSPVLSLENLTLVAPP